MISATNKPFLWDFARQQIDTLDCPGQASPPPGMPFFAGENAMVRYLRDQGYRYLVITPPDNEGCLYSRKRWMNKRHGNSNLNAQWARYFLDFFGNLDRLQEKGAVVWEDIHLKVIDLEAVR